MSLDLSIIIPCYNSASTIERCINSIPLSMDPEIIIVDDCSKDDSVNIIKDIIRNSAIHNVYVYENKENKGAGETRNIGIRYATKKYIMFLDSDDMLSEDFGKIVSEVLNHDNDAIVFDSARLSKNSISSIDMFYSKKIKRGYISPKEALVYIRAATWGKIYRRKIITDYNVSFGKTPRNEDLVFTKTAIAHCDKIEYLQSELYIYTDNPNSLMNKKELLDENNALIAFGCIKNGLKDLRLDDELNSIYFIEVIYASTKTMIMKGNTDKECQNYFKEKYRFYKTDDKYRRGYDNKFRIMVWLYRLGLFFTVRKLLGVR